MAKLTHLDDQGQAHMVDVSGKDETRREARAQAFISMSAETLELIVQGGHKKGDVLAVARIAAIQGAKRCSDLIPLCHPLMLSAIEVDFVIDQDGRGILIETVCRLKGATGVEMEALTAASVAALTIYDMCKAVDRGMVIGEIRLLEKKGGRSGHWQAST